MRIFIALLLSIFITTAKAADNVLTVTVGSGLTMRTIDVGAGVQSSGVNLVGITGTSILGTAGVSNTAVLSVQGIASGTALPISGTITANAGSNLNTSALALDATLLTTNTNLGAPGVTACATDNGSCSNNALIQRTNQRITSLITALGSPFQAGANIGNTSFASTQSGTWTVQPGNTANTTPWLITGSGAAGTAATGVITVQGIASMTKLLVTPDSVALPANQSVNVSQINAVTPLMGNGITGTGSQRVTIASDNTAFAVNSTLSPETTKVIGTVNISAAQTIATTNAGTFAVQLTGATNNINNIAGTVSLPTGAGTAANQTAIQAPIAAATATATKSVLLGGQYDSTQKTLTTGQQAAVSLSPRGAIITAQGADGQYPVGSTAITASATGTTAATTATLAGVVGKTTFICGFAIRANATAAATGTATVTGTITATMSFVQWTAPLASGIGLIEQQFSPCVPASGTNTGIAIVSAAPGSGGTVSSAGWGYQL